MNDFDRLMKLLNELAFWFIEFVVIMAIFTVAWVGISLPLMIWLGMQTGSYVPGVFAMGLVAYLLILLIKWILGK